MGLIDAAEGREAAFVDDPRWLRQQQDRWLAFLEHRTRQRGVRREFQFYEIEEACGFEVMEACGIMQKAAKTIRKRL